MGNGRLPRTGKAGEPNNSTLVLVLFFPAFSYHRRLMPDNKITLHAAPPDSLDEGKYYFGIQQYVAWLKK